MQELNDLLAITMRVRSYQIILLNETTRGFVLFHCYPPRQEMALSDWQIDSRSSAISSSPGPSSCPAIRSMRPTANPCCSGTRASS